MFKKDPEGYRKLLAYQKAAELQIYTNKIVANFPKTKTFIDLADQMSRSGRSGSKNIVEGWKRNTTKEYFDFLGFSIGAIEELKDDAADVATGVYPALLGIKGVMGEKGSMGQKGVMGDKRVEREERGLIGQKGNPLHPLPSSAPLTHFHPSVPLVPFHPISREELDRLKFYPLDQNLPAVIQLFLRAKEVNFLLYKLQQSLDVKMDQDHTKPASQRFSANEKTEKQNDAEFQKYLQSLGFKRSENGKMININGSD